MFVGATGIGRVVQRTVELMKRARHRRRRAPTAAIDVATLQRYLNFHYSVSLDLFGAETSTNAANYFAAGLKGRFQEERRDDDHRLAGRDLPGADPGRRGRWREREAPALAALNETLRDDYVADCQKGVDRWNRTLAEVGLELRLPHHRVQPRASGVFGGRAWHPDGPVAEPGGVGAAVAALAADRRGQHVRRVADAPRARARADGRVDRAAGQRHPRRSRVDYDYVRA